jgi:glutamyl-tRNA reductase
MNLTLAGISHRSAPVEVRERLSIPELQLQNVLKELVASAGIREALILSTCSRVEVAVAGEVGIATEPLLRGFLAKYHRCDPAAYDRYLYWHRDGDVIRHLFRVACSLDSMILGDPQILSQVKKAYLTASAAGALHGILGEVSERALAVGRRVRRETGLGARAASVSYVAVELARRVFGTLRGKTIFILGAGKMGKLTARHLASRGATSILVANRTFERAAELAASIGGTAVPFENMFGLLGRADIVVGSTSAPEFLITRELVEQTLAGRGQRRMLFIDIGVPRDVDPAVNALANAFLFDIDALQEIASENRSERRTEAKVAEMIVKEELARTLSRVASRELAPTIVGLEQRLESIRTREVERYSGRLANLSPDQCESIDALTRRIASKIFHLSVTAIKSSLDRPEQRVLVNLVETIGANH